MNQKLWTTALVGGLALAVTLILFFFGFPADKKAAADWLTLVFIIFAEAALFCGIGVVLSCDSAKKKPVLGSAIVFALFLYWVLIVASYIFARNIFLRGCGGLAAIQATLTVIFAAVVGALFYKMTDAYQACRAMHSILRQKSGEHKEGTDADD